MNDLRIEAVLDCQSDLLAAIDRQDADAIVRASEALAAAVSMLGNDADWPEFVPAANRLRLALEQNTAALQRLNLMRHWTRQRIDRINELRSGRTA
jgi:hypothetical protein